MYVSFKMHLKECQLLLSWGGWNKRLLGWTRREKRMQPSSDLDVLYACAFHKAAEPLVDWLLVSVCSMEGQ